MRNMGKVWAVEAVTLNFLTESDSGLLLVGFGEITFLK